MLTTIVFWSSDFWFGSKLARYLGAVIELTIGYGVKYLLNKRYVFIQQEF
ncbi:MAG: hypothetical protein O2971_09230 [Proteobacteria bacterium]|nr:hypothetical protein [Pseudomonadota bacterium]